MPVYQITPIGDFTGVLVIESYRDADAVKISFGGKENIPFSRADLLTAIADLLDLDEAPEDFDVDVVVEPKVDDQEDLAGPKTPDDVEIVDEN